MRLNTSKCWRLEEEYEGYKNTWSYIDHILHQEVKQLQVSETIPLNHENNKIREVPIRKITEPILNFKFVFGANDFISRNYKRNSMTVGPSTGSDLWQIVGIQCQSSFYPIKIQSSQSDWNSDSINLQNIRIRK